MRSVAEATATGTQASLWGYHVKYPLLWYPITPTLLQILSSASVRPHEDMIQWSAS